MQVRDGQRTVVTCPTCECRLQENPLNRDVYLHYGFGFDRDARGCKCANLQDAFRLLENGNIVREFAG
jgi:hypothetical protein